MPLDVGGWHGILRALQDELSPCHSGDAGGFSSARHAERCWWDMCQVSQGCHLGRATLYLSP